MNFMRDSKLRTVNRKDKIRILQAIKDQRLSIESLQPPKIYIFHQVSDRPGVYEMNGKIFNGQQYQDFCEKVKQRNNNSLIWNETKTYTEDKIITFRPAPNCEPLDD